jgi:hypothetical protein
MAIAVKEELQQSGESFQCVYKSIEMPPGANESIARFLDTVEAATGVNDLCLGSCSVSQTTLEQVFLKVTSTK